MNGVRPLESPPLKGSDPLSGGEGRGLTPSRVGAVRWELTSDVEVYAERVWELLARDAAANTVALTVIEDVRAGRPFAGPPVFGWLTTDDGHAAGAVSMTPPYELLLAVVPDGTAAPLAAALRERRAEVPGVNGDPAVVRAFADAWTDGTDVPQHVGMQQWLYRLGSLAPPDPPPAGHPRRAREDEAALLAGYVCAFQAEAGAHGTDAAHWVATHTGARRLWVWETPEREVGAMAGRTPTVAGVARVAPVYTPPEQRRRGYGAAVTAAVTQDALATDARDVVLFTDRTNATSNRVYQRIGFAPIAEREVIRFG